MDSRERGREKERERNIVRNINQLPPIRAPTGDQTFNPDMFPDQELNPRPFSLQDNAQPAEPRWARLTCVF